MIRPFSMAALVCAAALAPATAHALTVGVVDVQQAMRATDHWTQAKDFLEGQKRKLESRLDEKQAELEKRREELDAKRAVSTAAATQEEDAAWMAEAQMLSREMMGAQQRLTQLEQRLTQELFARLSAVVQQVAQTENYDFVFDTGSEVEANVVYFVSKTDLTQRVVALYKERFKDQPLQLPKS